MRLQPCASQFLVALLLLLAGNLCHSTALADQIQVTSPDPNNLPNPPLPSPDPSYIGEEVTIKLNAVVTQGPAVSSDCAQSSPTWGWSTQDPQPTTEDPNPPAVVQFSSSSINGPWINADASDFVLTFFDHPSTSDSAATVKFQFTKSGYFRISPIVTASFGTGGCCQGQTRPVYFCDAQDKPPKIKIKQLKWEEGKENYWKEKENNIYRPKPGNQIKFEATIDPDTMKRKIRFELVNTSKVVGKNMNSGAETGFDLLFQPQNTDFEAPTNEGQKILTKKEVASIVVVVTADDYGPYGKIKAVIDGTTIESETIRVLKDEDGNDIEDAWDTAFPGPTNSKDKDDDDDSLPDIGTAKGDRLTRYEEYRGFTIKGDKYVTSDPKKKTVFLCDKTGYTVTDGGGDPLSLFSKLEVEVFFIEDTQIKEITIDEVKRRVINFNGYKNYQQAVFVESSDKAGTGGQPGRTNGKGVAITTILPSNYEYCRIWIDSFKEEVKLALAMKDNADDLPAVTFKGTSVTTLELNEVWWENGKVKIGNEIIQYKKVLPPISDVNDTKTETHKFPADSTALIVTTFPQNFGHIQVGEEIMEGLGFHKGGGGKLEAFGKEDTSIKHQSGKFVTVNKEHIVYLEIYSTDDPDKSEWISYSVYADDTFKEIKRGLFGTAKIEVKDAAKAKYVLPGQLFVKRGQFKTTAKEIPKDSQVEYVGVFVDVKRGTPRAAHAVDDRIAIFSNRNDAIRSTAAHEAGHTVALNHFDDPPFNLAKDVFKIMHKTLQPGSYLAADPADGGVYNDYTKQEKSILNAR